MEFKEQTVYQIPRDQIIEPKEAIRTSINEDKIEELAESIKEHGIIEPIIVKRSGEKLEVIAGHRRFMAATKIALPFLPCIIRSVDQITEDNIMLHENYGHEQMNPIDEAYKFSSVMERNKWNIEQLANTIRKSKSYVEKRISLLSIQSDLKDAMTDGYISMSVAIELSKIDNEAERTRVLEHAKQFGVSTRSAAMFTNQWELTKQTIDLTQQPERTAENTMPAGPVLWKCFICDTLKNATETYTVPLCPHCREEMLKAKKIGNTEIA